MTTPRRELLMAYRWPAAVVLSSLVLAGAAAVLAWTAVRLLSKPIPVAIEGGLQVDKLVLPPSVTIRAEQPLPVMVTQEVRIAGDAPLGIKGPLTVRAIEGAVQVKGDVDARATVAGIDNPVTVTTDQPLPVQGDVVVKEKVMVGGNVTVEGNVGAKVRPGLLPLP